MQSAFSHTVYLPFKRDWSVLVNRDQKTSDTKILSHGLQILQNLFIEISVGILEAAVYVALGYNKCFAYTR